MKPYLPTICAAAVSGLLLLACATAQNLSWVVNGDEVILTGPATTTLESNLAMRFEGPTIESVSNFGTNLVVNWHQGESSFGYIQAIHNGAFVPDRPEKRWREVYGVRDGKIVFLGKQEPQPVTVRQTNVTESVTYEYPNP